MRFNCKKTFAVILSVLFFALVKASADTLTIGQAFNWKAGDIITYRPYDIECPGSSPCTTTWTPNFEMRIITRVDQSDTIVYGISYSSPDSTIDKTVTISNLSAPVPYDSILGMLFLSLRPCAYPERTTCTFMGGPPDCSGTSYIDTNFFDRLCNRRYRNLGYPWLFCNTTYCAGIGIQKFESYSGGLHYSGSSTCGFKLSYYKTDSTEWMDTAVYNGTVGINEPAKAFESLQIFPNPTNENLWLQIPNNEIALQTSIKIFDVEGRQVYFEQSKNTIEQEISLNNLQDGVYLIVLENKTTGKIYRSRFIKQ